ncbi:MAG: hypothetical protein OEX83_04570 [Gammaproteobacteria bacterium]|nr:hypothetical protein [Gammaproteobacteria bacterium]
MEITGKKTIEPSELILLPIHIDAARNSTDDFNLFHDKHKWQQIKDNPFAGPIALGFQLECLLENFVHQYRHSHKEYALMEEMGLYYSNYQYTFADVVKPGQRLKIDIRPSRHQYGDDILLGNRIALYADEHLAMRGYKKESQYPLYKADLDIQENISMRDLKDRTFIDQGDVFVKLKYLNTGNAKNFMCGSMVEQSDYIDELENTVRFPESFPTALISCALLERARVEGHDFEAEPMVYTSHKISIDRRIHSKLASNNILALLVSAPVKQNDNKGLGNTTGGQHLYYCQCLTQTNEILFHAQITMAPLEEILRVKG